MFRYSPNRPEGASQDCEAFVSPTALRLVRIATAWTSFEGSSALLRELAGLAIAPRVERHAEALEREIATVECLAIEPEPCDVPTLCLGLDGTGTPARNTEGEGREDPEQVVRTGPALTMGRA